MKPIIRQKLNIIIDIIMFILMLALAVIGYIIRFILIPGEERWIKFGKNVELTGFGLDRHEWGLVHLIIGIVLIVLLVLHLVFHWSLILGLLKKLIPHTKARIISVAGVLTFSFCMLLSPFFFPVEIGQPIQGQGHQHFSEKVHEQSSSIEKAPVEKEISIIRDSIAPVIDHHSGEEERTMEIRGSYSIGFVAEKYNVSSEELKKALKIPLSVSNSERLGRIRRTYGFSMHDVENCIIKIQNNK